MRKILLGLAATAAIAAPLTAATAANADTVTTVTGATFTVNQPKDEVAQWGNVWKHDYTVTVHSDGNFTGTGQITDNGGAFAWAETINGTFTDSATDADTVFDHVSFDTIPVGGGATFAVTDAPMDNTTVPVQSSWTANDIEFRIAKPVFQTAINSTTPTCMTSAAVSQVEHTEHQWAALVAKPSLHWDYKWTTTTKNPSTDLAHIWVKSLDLTKKGWPQITRTVVDTPAKDAVSCDANGSVTWKYGSVTGTLVFDVDADGGTFDYAEDNDGQTLHGVVDAGSPVTDGTKTTFTGTITGSNVNWNLDRPFTVVIDGARVGVFVDRDVDNILADVTSGSITIG